MIVKKYDLATENYIEVEAIGIVKYIGKSFGIESLTDRKNYYVIAVEDEYFRIIDDSEEDYLYSIYRPSDLIDIDKCGKWEIIKDNTSNTLKKAIEKYSIL